MTNSILQNYFDACELVKETEDDIRRLRRKKALVLTDKVQASNPEFPYQPISVTITGSAMSLHDHSRLDAEEAVLIERKERAEALRQEVTSWMNTIPIRMQRIIRFRYMEGMSWADIAAKLGRGATEASVKMEYSRFIEKSEN